MNAADKFVDAMRHLFRDYHFPLMEADHKFDLKNRGCPTHEDHFREACDAFAEASGYCGVTIQQEIGLEVK